MLFGSYPQNAITQTFVIEKLDVVCPGDNIVFEFNGYRYIRIITNAAYDEYITKTGVKIGKGNKLYFKFDPIEWKVINDDGKSLLLETVNVIDFVPYLSFKKRSERFSKSYIEGCGTNYENSDLRNWLNDYFYNLAFSNDDKDRILKAIVDNSRKSRTFYDFDVCPNTNDYVFVLSEADAMEGKNLNDPNSSWEDPKLIAFATDYCKAKGLNVGSVYSVFERKIDAADYWTRSPRNHNNLGTGYVNFIRYTGGVFSKEVWYELGVRPRIKIKK